jgi:hypothetical protein
MIAGNFGAQLSNRIGSAKLMIKKQRRKHRKIPPKALSDSTDREDFAESGVVTSSYLY